MKLSKVEDGKNPSNLHRTLALEMVRVTERAAIAAKRVKFTRRQPRLRLMQRPAPCSKNSSGRQLGEN